MIKKIWFKEFVLSLAVAVFCVTALTGCASLRKKFTRPPKPGQNQDQFIPVLQPEEYKKVEELPRQQYRDNYTMLRSYFKDLWEVLGRHDSSEKREKYIFKEILAHFDVMTALLTDQKKAEAAGIRGRIEHVLKEYDKPGLRRYDLIEGNMRKIERDLYKAFKPDAVANNFVSKSP